MVSEWSYQRRREMCSVAPAAPANKKLKVSPELLGVLRVVHWQLRNAPRVFVRQMESKNWRCTMPTDEFQDQAFFRNDE